MIRTNELLPCPFCGGEATVERIGKSGYYYVACNTAYCCDFGRFDTEAEAIAAWNTRATHGTLTAEQVSEAAHGHYELRMVRDVDGLDVPQVVFDWQAIANGLNAKLGSGTKPCYAADENYKRCKYSVNRGWCDDAPFLVWDDTGHLFITMGGLKTWDVTDDAKKWFAELGSGTCENVWAESGKFKCSECAMEVNAISTNTTAPRPIAFCPCCGREVVSE